MELLTVNLLLFFICTSKPLCYTLDDREQTSLNLAVFYKYVCEGRVQCEKTWKHGHGITLACVLASTKKLNLTFS